MLKKICRLFLGLVVFMGSACVTPTHASSANPVVLVHIQAGSIVSAKDEMVSIYNNSPNEVDISDWCIKNKAHIAFACFETDETFAYILLPYSFAVVATELFIANTPAPPESILKYITITNQSSGSIVNSNDVISVVNSVGEVVDTYSWTTAIPSGKLATRSKSLANPQQYETIDPLLSWTHAPLLQMPMTMVEARERPPVLPPDTPPENEMPETEPNLVVHPSITEILPNPAGSDTGNEFIELYNNSDQPINLSEYKIRVGSNLEKIYSFPADTTLLPYTYGAFTNSQIAYTLLNSSSKVQLEYQNQLIGEAVSYENPIEAESWALIDTAWQYTNTLTPGTENKVRSTETAPETAKPCAANQYRSPETNRCRLITTASGTTPKPCTEGQVRSAETNRCRNVATSSEPAPCKENQYRNSETNRCKNIVKMTNTDYGVKGVSSEQSPVNWYLWLGIAGVVTLIVGYGVWEWREELKKLIETVRQKFARSK